jgi:hypothetical protein
MDANNYRPISNLPTFSKVLENCFLIRLTNFFRDNDLLPPSLPAWFSEGEKYYDCSL